MAASNQNANCAHRKCFPFVSNVGPAKRREIALEIAVLGRSGLDVNDPDSKYKLKTLPDTYSGLHLLASMYSAFHQIDPKM